jgi:pimeloyl-ACP methyl ester carboxylesterase
MLESLPAARLRVLPGYGHGINLLAPELCVQEIKSFIRDTPT